MKTFKKEIHINTTKQFQLYPITKQVEQILADSGIKNGVCTIFAPHSTAGIRLNENETLLHQDIMKMMYRTAPLDISYGHDSFEARSMVAPDERSNGHAHAKTFIIGSSESIPVGDGHALLGPHQNIFFVEKAKIL
jgi:secondary thiamine-phosphate synthase enzyme